VIVVMRNQDSPEPAPPGMLPAGSEKKVLHCEFRIKATVLMGSDGNCSGKPEFKGIALTYPAADAAESQRVFAALSAGGQVQMPLMKTFFSESFGMVADKFGVMWMVIVPQPHPA
jgi:PhnB protein